MNYELWLGTLTALDQLSSIEQFVMHNFSELLDRRKAFLDLDDDEDDVDERPGDYLIRNNGNGVNVIKVQGSLVRGYKWYHRFFPSEVTSYEAIGDALALSIEDGSVNEIVLDISSGGGMVMGIDEVSKKIRRADSIKPVRAHTSSAAFSAAYWIASAAREISASEMAEVGSIGTLMVHQSIARAAQNAGVDFTVFRAGKYKAIGLPYEQLDDTAKDLIQADLDKANSFFLNHVSARRHVSLESKGVWAEGKTFYAGEAQQIGLLDRIASLEDLIGAPGATHHRSKPMFISDEKRAQIAAGANPEDVLTAEELKQYQAELEEHEEPEGGDGEEEETEGEEQETPPASASDAAQAESGDSFHKVLRENGKLEARVEHLKEQLTAAQTKLSTAREQMSSLQEIGKLAVSNLQVALGKSQETPSSAEGLVATYNSLQKEMASRFNRGQKSSPAPVEGDDDASAFVPLAFRTRK